LLVLEPVLLLEREQEQEHSKSRMPLVQERELERPSGLALERMQLLVQVHRPWGQGRGHCRTWEQERRIEAGHKRVPEELVCSSRNCRAIGSLGTVGGACRTVWVPRPTALVGRD